MFPEHTPDDLPGTRLKRTHDRIVEGATEQIFEQGYHGFKMDRLAESLGMSKKTIYVHFRGKEAILMAVVTRLQRELANQLEGILIDERLEFPERLSALITAVFMALRRIKPGVFEEFKRYAPAVFRTIDEVRKQLIPRVFGQLIEEGLEHGYIRAEIDPHFAALAWLQTVRGMTEPEILEETGLSPSQTVKQAYALFWPGMLTDKGRAAVAKARSGEVK